MGSLFGRGFAGIRGSLDLRNYGLIAPPSNRFPNDGFAELRDRNFRGRAKGKVFRGSPNDLFTPQRFS